MSPYSYRWRTIIRPETLRRDGYECVRCGAPDRPLGLKSTLDVAHLNGDPTDNSLENRATLCRRCHRAHDYLEWSIKFREWLRKEKERRIDEADRRRPLLQLLAGALDKT